MKKPQPFTDAEAFAWLQQHTTPVKRAEMKELKEDITKIIEDALADWQREKNKALAKLLERRFGHVTR